MRQGMIQRIINKRGASYVLTCVLILITVILIFIALEYAHIYHIARTQKEETQIKLDSYITVFALSSYDALKQGDIYAVELNTKEMCEGAMTVLGFPTAQFIPYIEIENEKYNYTMTRPQIGYLYEDGFGVIVTYELIIPFEMWNRKIADISVPIEIVSIYTRTY